MNRESAWEKFKKSGRVGDYLSYRAKPIAQPDIELDEDSIYSGAKHENKFKWNNYTRSGRR